MSTSISPAEYELTITSPPLPAVTFESLMRAVVTLRTSLVDDTVPIDADATAATETWPPRASEPIAVSFSALISTEPPQTRAPLPGLASVTSASVVVVIVFVAVATPTPAAKPLLIETVTPNDLASIVPCERACTRSLFPATTSAALISARVTVEISLIDFVACTAAAIPTIAPLRAIVVSPEYARIVERSLACTVRSPVALTVAPGWISATIWLVTLLYDPDPDPASDAAKK